MGEESVITGHEKLEAYGRDATDLIRLPELVVEPQGADQIQALLRLANEYRFPVTPRGLGTGLTGGSVPVCGGVLLSMARMNRILSVDPRNMIAVVEPGVVTADLKKVARAKGLFYPPDPASLDTCSIGGNAATNAGGPACVKYGTTRNYVLGLEAVLPNGERIMAGVQTRKGVVGYDLAHLIVGSEGTLGVITKLILKLIPHPPAVSTLVSFFPDLPSTMEAVTAILTGGHIPSAMEFMDRHCLELVGDLLTFESVERSGAFLLLEADGLPVMIQQEIEQMGEICLTHGALDVFLAPDSHRRNKMWEVRKEVSLRIEHDSPLYIPEDVVVPIGRIAEFVNGLPLFEKRYSMKIYAFGHAGDGNIHLNITATDRNARPRIEQGISALLREVLSLGGTISGEHGIGFAKKRFLPLELSAESICLQKKIKNIFDPLHILNPAKIFD